MQNQVKRAMSYMLLSTASFALMNALIRRLNHLPAMELVMFRAFGSAIIATTFLVRNRIPILGNQKRLLLLRAVLGVCAMSLFFASIKYLPLGISVSLRYTSPIFGVILAWILLKERIKLLQGVFLVLAFSGVAVMHGYSEDLHSLGLLLIFLAALFSGMVYVTLRKIGTSEHPVVVVNYFMVLATIAGCIGTLYNWVRPDSVLEWLMLPALGVCGYFGQLYMTKAFGFGKTHQVAPFKYAEVVFGLISGILLFNETYSLWSYIGITMIIGGLISYALVKNNE